MLATVMPAKEPIALRARTKYKMVQSPNNRHLGHHSPIIFRRHELVLETELQGTVLPGFSRFAKATAL